jgi:hypothetical protein
LDGAKELEGSTFDLKNLNRETPSNDYSPYENVPVSVLKLHGQSINNDRYRNTPMYKDTIALSEENLTERNSVNRSMDHQTRKKNKREQKKIRQDV